MNKKKLLIATDNFLPRIDGVSMFLSQIIPSLLDDYEITVVAPNYGKYSPDGYKLTTIPLGKFGSGDYVSAQIKPRRIKELVKKADIVFTQSVGPIGFLAIWYSKLFKKPCASFMHSVESELVPMSTKNIWLRRILYPLMKVATWFIYNRTKLMIMPSDGILEKISWYRIRTRKEVVNLGVDCNYFLPYKEMKMKDKKTVDLLKLQLGLENTFVIGNHGRLAREKDLMTLLRAYRWLRKKHKDARLIILGDGLKELKKKLGSVEGVIVPGAKLNINIYLALMDVYVTSSLTETTSLSTLEAMATGLPVISTPVGFIKEYIKDNVNGFFYPIRDEYSLYKKIDLLKKNRVLAKTIGERARKTVVNRFMWKDTVAGIKDALKSIEK